jgi:hypothetical protein
MMIASVSFFGGGSNGALARTVFNALAPSGSVRSMSVGRRFEYCGHIAHSFSTFIFFNLHFSRTSGPPRND